MGGNAPESGAPEGCFGGKIAILGGYAPENSTVPKPPKLSGHAPEHPVLSDCLSTGSVMFLSIFDCHIKNSF